MDQIRPTTRVGIIGGGFGGLNAAQSLGSKKNIEVTLIDQRNHHLFQPLLYQVATAGLSPADIASPIRSVLSKHSNVEVLMQKVHRIDAALKTVFMDEESRSFDYLILACGATHSYFGHEEWEEHAPGLKTLEQATEIRRRILSAFEEAERSKDLDTQRADLTFVVVGGGPTGVELAGSIAELGRVSLQQDFRNIDPSRTRVLLIEAGPRLLAGFDPDLSANALHDLEFLGVQVWLNSRVTEITKQGVRIGSDFIASRTVVWAAGVATSPLAAQLAAPTDKAGRVIVNPDLSVPGQQNIFVVGDMAAVKDDRGQLLPGLAPVALQEGRFAARNILRDLKDQPRLPFRYFDKGMMATVGRKKAVLQSQGIKISGFFAWLAWLFIHVYYLIGFRNRLVVLLIWAWSYLTFKRGARLIVSRDWKMNP